MKRSENEVYSVCEIDLLNCSIKFANLFVKCRYFFYTRYSAKKEN